MKTKSISVSPTLRRFLIHCEQYCIADCCYSSAFALDSETVSRWLCDERIDRTEALIAEARGIAGSLAPYEKIDFDIRNLESTWDLLEAMTFFLDCADAIESGKDRGV